MLRDGQLCRALFWKQRGSNNSVRVLVSPKHPGLGVNGIIQGEVGFIRKQDIIQEFLVIVDLLQKPQIYGYRLFHIDLCELLLDFDLVGIKFELLNQNAVNRRYSDSKFLAPPSQRSWQTLVDWLLNLGDILGWPDSKWRLWQWRTPCPTIFRPTWKSDNCLEIC